MSTTAKTALHQLVRHNRYTYSEITTRPNYSWPEGRKLAVYLGLNLECFSFGTGLGAELAPSPGLGPDVLNYSWRDYGNRVGAPRMLELFDALDLPVTILANSALSTETPGLVEGMMQKNNNNKNDENKKAYYELAGHGRTNAERQGDLSEADEAALIAEATEILTQQQGQQPEPIKGWLGPWISQSHVTPDLLQEQGYEYLLDWCHDDQPTWMQTRGGTRILSVPYPQELNDIPQIVGRKREGHEFGDMIIDAFDVMLQECIQHDRPLVMGIALHGYLMGQPHRIKHLERALRYMQTHRDAGDMVWWTTAGAINDHYRSLDL